MSFFKDVKNKIINAITRRVNRATRRAIPDITKRVKAETLSVWQNSETYQSLIAGDLRHEFGFYDGTEIDMVDNFLYDASQSLSIEFKEFTRPVGKFFGGGLYIYVLKQDIQSILASPHGSFLTEKGFSIDWARWLLTQGNRIIITGYKFRGGLEQYSRSGDGIMIKANQGSWRVPPGHSGVIGDNWLSRGLQESIGILDNKYSIIFEQEIGKNLKL